MVMPILACHDELVIEYPEEKAEEVARFLEEIIVVGADRVLDTGC
jgi:DNA polymerase I-like protein with 3'-5' exonuclease and polymerase domains